MNYIFMKPRMIAFAICLVMLVFTLVGCVNYEDEDKDVNATAFVYTPAGKLITHGDCDGYFLGSDGFIQVTIDGIKYRTHISNVTIIEVEE